MSLSKRYAVGCESTDLQMRWQMRDRPQVPLDATRPERQELRRECLFYSPEEMSSKAARARAKREGWVRYSERFPLYQGSTDTTRITLDICPGCVPKLIPDHVPAK
jgi:hypothetical protein